MRRLASTCSFLALTLTLACADDDAADGADETTAGDGDGEGNGDGDGEGDGEGWEGGTVRETSTFRGAPAAMPLTPRNTVVSIFPP